MTSNNVLNVNSIIKFSNVDGTGNRYVVFTQECNINCIYCHNFETINQCSDCMICTDHCKSKAITNENGKVKFDKTKCSSCDTCIHICENRSTPKAVKMTVDEIFEDIKKVKSFLRGVTISGGECTLQHKAVYELVKRVQEELNLVCFIDSNGYFDMEEIKPLVEIGTFIIDIKGTGNTENIIGVKETNRNIENLRKLLHLGKVEEVRTVVTNDIDYFEKVIKDVKEILKEYDVFYKIIGMHSHGDENLKKLEPTKEQLEYLKNI